MKQHFKVTRLRLVAAVTIACAAVAGCGGDSDSGDGYYPPPVTPPGPATVPIGAGVSIAAFFSYVRGLATNDTDEPVLLSTFVAPSDETSEPTAIP